MSQAMLTTRSGKGSQLTWSELDGNWTNLEVRTGSGWNDLVQEVTVKSGANAPTLTQYRNGIYAYEFGPAVMAEVFANFHLRHDYDDTGGAYAGMIYPHVHWSANTTGTGTVRFGVEYTCARRDDAGNVGTTTFGPTTTIYIEHTIPSDEQYRHQVSEPVDGAGIPLLTQLQVDGIILCRFFRDADHVNDTFPEPIHLLTVDIHYPCDVAATPNRAYPFG